MLKQELEGNQPMPDDIHCALGRVQQSIDDLKSDMNEIKVEQKRVADYITAQRAGFWFVTAILSAIGAAILGFHEEVVKYFGFKLPN